MLALDALDDAGWFTPADGGSVSWTQSILADKKERYVTSGFGAELVVKRLGL